MKKLKRKLRVAIYLNHPKGAENGCTLYRHLTPMKYLGKYLDVKYVNKVESSIEYNPIEKKVYNISLDVKEIEWADVVVFARHYQEFALVGCLSEVAKNLGKVVIYETDDLLHKIEQNVGKYRYEAMGIKNQLKSIDAIMDNCDLITASTDYLRDFLVNKYNVKGVTLPNSFDPARWRLLYFYKKLRDFWRKKIKRDKTIRIGWHGGNNHFLNNFKYVIPPLNKLKEKYGDKIEFVIMCGQHPNVDLYGKDDNDRKFFNFNFEYRKPAKLNKFPRKSAEMDLDIGIIVVEDNEFSRAKSNIKWIEYGLLGIPSISSNCEPYKKTNAILVDNSEEQWINTLEDLVENSKKRDIMGREARKMILRDFNIKNNNKLWVKAYEDAFYNKKELEKVKVANS